jgi:hypothetical protein
LAASSFFFFFFLLLLIIHVGGTNPAKPCDSQGSLTRIGTYNSVNKQKKAVIISPIESFLYFLCFNLTTRPHAKVIVLLNVLIIA